MSAGPPAGFLTLEAGWDARFDDRFRTAVAAIDEVNRQDPTQVELAGTDRPEAEVHAEQMTAWVLRLDPGADESQLLAARAHHLRRWALPRHTYPEGRSGYLRWRTDLKRRQADDAAALLADAGYAEAEIDPVVRIMRKEGLGREPAVQVHEDALCLVFVTFQFADLARRLGHDHMVEVVRKTLGKMSDRAVGEVLALELDPDDRAVIDAAAAA